jgi:hypothetical protein
MKLISGSHMRTVQRLRGLSRRLGVASCKGENFRAASSSSLGLQSLREHLYRRRVNS